MAAEPSYRARTEQEIFSAMHSELRHEMPDVPESPERLDPIVRTLMKLYAKQLSTIEKRIDKVWDVARNSLIRSLYPEAKRWPVPAYTVIRCQLKDPSTVVDQTTKAIYRDDREGGETLFFTPAGPRALVSTTLRHLLIGSGSTFVDLAVRTSADDAADSRHRMHTVPNRAYIGLEYDGDLREFRDSLIFLGGELSATQQYRWGRWIPADESGNFNSSAAFIPAEVSSIDRIIGVKESSALDWGGMRSTQNLFGTLESRYVIPAPKFLSVWQRKSASEETAAAAFGSGIELHESKQGLLWIRVDLPEGGDKSGMLHPMPIYTDTYVAFNRNDLSVFCHTAGNVIVELEIPEPIDNIVEISRVRDSSGDEYTSVKHSGVRDHSLSYAVEERDDRLILWFDYSSRIQPPPDSIVVDYKVTAGRAANGISPGKINDLYENHPGIESCTNVIPSAGAIPAKSLEQVVTEATARLRNRDRALSFLEIGNWARAFDPRIRNVSCSNSTQLTDRGVRRCVLVRLRLDMDQMHSRDEIQFLKHRLGEFLKSRAPLNSNFTVEVEGEK